MAKAIVKLASKAKGKSHEGGVRKTAKTTKIVAAERTRKEKEIEKKDDEDVEVPKRGHCYSDDWVATWLADSLSKRKKTVLKLLRCWQKPILKQDIPGFKGKRHVTPGMFANAQREVLRFYAREERKGNKSHVVQAFRLASGEKKLRFCWSEAVRRVKEAKLDFRQKVDGWSWGRNYAMTSGDTNATGVIYISGHRRVNKECLTSLICHEGLHNFVKRDRVGNPWLSCDVEHQAMALLGDPQLPAVV